MTYTIKAPLGYTHYKKVGAVKVYYRSANPQYAAVPIWSSLFFVLFLWGLLLFSISCFGPLLAEHYAPGTLGNAFDTLIKLPSIEPFPLRILFIILEIIGFLMCTFILTSLIVMPFCYSDFLRTSRPVETTGTVTAVESKTRTIMNFDESQHYEFIISFTDINGEKHTIAVNGLIGKVGDKVKIRYNPLSPEDAKAHESETSRWLMIFSLLTTFAIIALFILGPLLLVKKL